MLYQCPREDRSELGLARKLGFDCRGFVNAATMFRQYLDRFSDVAARSTLMFADLRASHSTCNLNRKAARRLASRLRA